MKGTTVDRQALTDGAGGFPLKPLLSGAAGHDGDMTSWQARAACVSAVGGAIEGTMVGTPLLLLFVIGLLALAWAAASGTRTRRLSFRESSEATSGSQPPPTCDSERPRKLPCGPPPPLSGLQELAVGSSKSSPTLTESRGLSNAPSPSIALTPAPSVDCSGGIMTVGVAVAATAAIGNRDRVGGGRAGAVEEDWAYAVRETECRKVSRESCGSLSRAGEDAKNGKGEGLRASDGASLVHRDSTVGGLGLCIDGAGTLSGSSGGEDRGSIADAESGRQQQRGGGDDIPRLTTLVDDSGGSGVVTKGDGIRGHVGGNGGRPIDANSGAEAARDWLDIGEKATEPSRPQQEGEQEGEAAGFASTDSPRDDGEGGTPRGCSRADEGAARDSAMVEVAVEAEDSNEERLLARVRGLLQDLDRDLDAARVLLPECHRFRKVVSCVSESVGPGMGASSRQALDLREALEEATEFTRTLSSPESFVLVLCELLSDGYEDPSAMLGSSTRRLHRAVSALPEPSGSLTVAAAARAQLRALATAGTNGIIVGAAAGGAISRSPSFSASAAGGVNGVSIPPPPLTASSSATAIATPLSVTGPSGTEGARSGCMGSSGGGGGSSSHTPRPPSDERSTSGGGSTSAEQVNGSRNGRGAPSSPDSGDFSGNFNNDIDVDVNGEEVSTTCGGGGGGGGASSSNGGGGSGSGIDTPARTMGPSLTSEAAGLSDLIRRRGGMAALTDGRAVAAVLRAAAPRRSHSLNQRPRAFFDAEADDGAGAGTLSLSTPLRGSGGGVGDGGGDEGEGDAIESGGSGSLYVTATCGGFFGGSKSPQGLSPSDQGTLPWPSPQNANGVCQKLAKRVEARVEAMVPFTSTSPAPACERRRLRLVNKFLFSVLDRGDPFGDERGGDAGDASDNDGLGEFGSRRTDFHSRTKRRGENAPSPPDFEVRLYAVLGALLEAAKELLPGAREGGAAVNAVGGTTVLTLKGASALDRAPCTQDTSLTTVPRRTSMCQHALCTPRIGRKTLDGGARQEDGVLLVPDCRKLRQEIIRSTCMDPMGRVRPDHVAYVAAPIFADGAPLGTFCVFSRKSLKELGWTAHHTGILRGLADAASTEMMRICRLAELDCQRDQQQQHKLRRRIRSISNGTTSPQRHRPNPSSFLPPPAGVPASRGASHGGGVGEVTIVSSSRASPARSRSERTTRLLTNGDNAGSAIRGASSTMTVSAVSSATAYKNNGESDGDPTVSIPRTRGFFSGQSTRAVGDGGSMESSAHHVAWQERVDGGGGSGSASTSISYDSASGRSFLGRLNNVAPPAAVSRRRHGDGAGREGVYLGLSPLLGRAASEPSAVSPAALTVAVARGRAEGRGTAESAAKMLWSRALQKLKLKKRKNPAEGGSDEGTTGAPLARTEVGAGLAALQVRSRFFVERSRAW